MYAGAPARHAGPVEWVIRVATRADVPAMRRVMDAAIAELQRGFLDDAQIASSRAIMGIDTQLVDDGTYYVVECDGALAGCGGWSRRATLYGSDATPGRAPTSSTPRSTRPGSAPCTRLLSGPDAAWAAGSSRPARQRPGPRGSGAWS